MNATFLHDDDFIAASYVLQILSCQKACLSCEGLKNDFLENI